MPRRRKEMLNGSVSVSSVGRGFSSQLHHRAIVTKEKPQQRNAANARERARMRVLSRAFCRLKTTLPWVPADTKLSKLDTLRLATTYIGHLRTVLVEGSSGRTSPLPSHPVMSWPFMFNKSGNPPSNTSSSELDSPTSTVDHFGIHDCLQDDQPQNQRQLPHQDNSRSEIQIDSNYQISRHEQHDMDYCNMGLTTGLNYCGPDLQ